MSPPIVADYVNARRNYGRRRIRLETRHANAHNVFVGRVCDAIVHIHFAAKEYLDRVQQQLPSSALHCRSVSNI